MIRQRALTLMRPADQRRPDTAMDWQERALCAQTDPDLWHPDSRADLRRVGPVAKRVCSGCEVRVECLAYALATEGATRYGIYGGLTPEERAALVRAEVAS